MTETRNIKSKSIDMINGSITRSIILFAFPIILSDFLQQLYNSVDSIIVGNMVSKTALAAVGETVFIVNIFLGFFIGISLGATVSISKYFGAKDKDNLSKALNTTFKLTIILSIIFSIIGYKLVPFLLKLVGTGLDMYDDAYDYLSIIVGGIFTQIFYNMISGILKAIGDSKRPLYVLAFTVTLNILLDLLFVGPLNMGVKGAAYATVVAQGISSVILYIILLKTPEFEKPIIRKEKMNGRILMEILRVGFPYSIQRTITAFSNTIVISYINHFGSSMMASWTIYQKVDQFALGTILSVGSAATTFVAQNLGASKPDRIRKGVRTSMILAFSIASFYSTFFCIFRYPVIKLFTSDSEVIELSAMLFIYFMIIHVINSVTQIFAGALRGMGRSLGPTIIMLTCYVVIRQAYLHILWNDASTINLVIASFHLTWTICAILMLLLYLYRRKEVFKCYEHKNRV